MMEVSLVELNSYDPGIRIPFITVASWYQLTHVVVESGHHSVLDLLRCYCVRSCVILFSIIFYCLVYAMGVHVKHHSVSNQIYVRI